MIAARTLFVGLAMAGFIHGAAAQYPDRPIRVLVPNPPGGATDTTARALAPRLSELLGQPVVIENKPGANGNIATELAAKATPDGYTLLLCADAQIVISPHLYKMSVDPLKDLVPIASIGTTVMVLSVNPDLPVKTLPEFVAYAKQANPPLPYASIGAGSQHHLTMEILKQRAGIDLVHVPYRGGGPATVALMAGEVMAMFGGNSTAGQIRAGKIRALALAGAKRSALFPDLPTIGEFYPGFASQAWLALFAPSGLPPAVLARLRADAGRTIAEPQTAERLRNAGGLEQWVTQPDEFSAFIRAEYVKYAEVVKTAGVKIE